MQLVHTLQRSKSRGLVHLIYPAHLFEEETWGAILLAPTKLPHGCVLAAVSELPLSAAQKLIINTSLDIQLRVHIEDDSENRPLLSGCSQARALFLLEEVINCLCQGFAAFDLQFRSLSPLVESNSLLIELRVADGMPAYKLLGTALVLPVFIDSLLFARGLRVREKQCHIKNADRFQPSVILSEITQSFCSMS